MSYQWLPISFQALPHVHSPSAHRKKPAPAPLTDNKRGSQTQGTGLKLFNISLESNWPRIVASDQNEPLCGGKVVPARRIPNTFSELTDRHFELCLTLEA